MIIISRFNEDLSWTTEFPFDQYKYIVYNKGNNDNFEKKNVSEVINLLNVGRCDHTYLYHIVKNYDNLSSILIFLPGSLNMKKKKIIAKKLLITILKTNKAVFYCNYTNSIFHEFKNFSLTEWQCQDEKNKIENNEKSLFLSSIRPFGNWFLHHKLMDTNIYSYYGIFSVDKRDILNNSITKYENILNELSFHSNPEVGHYVERAWATIFGPFEHTLNIYHKYNI